jgi:hypothetical protein
LSNGKCHVLFIKKRPGMRVAEGQQSEAIAIADANFMQTRREPIRPS